MDSKQTANQGLNDLLDGLKREGVTARDLAAFVKMFVGPDPPTSGSDNFPGFEFSERVTTAAVVALAGHAKELNAQWANVRRGRFSVPEALQSWARVVEGYSGVVSQAVRNADVSQPVWQVIPYSKKADPPPRQSVRIDRTFTKETLLESTAFEGLGSVKAPEGMYRRKPTLNENRIEFTLDPDVLNGLEPPSDFLSLVFPQAMGTVPPVLIIILHVTD
jgi:hypothetical protein